MTAARFDAPASTSPAIRYGRPAYAHGDGVAFRIARLVWLAARFARRESVTIADYQHRFGVSLRSFHRDIALLRGTGFYIGTEARGTYHLLSFFADADHA